MSFQQGLSGLNATSKNLQVIGNNIANANTFGSKVSRAEFGDMYAAALNLTGANPVGIGVNLSTVAQQFTLDDTTTTENPMDLAINGPGFFQLTDGVNPPIYSRNGQFKVAREGFIANNSSHRLMGYPANEEGVIQPGQAVALQLPTAGVAPRQTSEIRIDANMDSRLLTTGVTASPSIDYADADTYNNATSLTVFDEKGQQVALTYYFQKADNDTWNVFATANGLDVMDPGGTPTVLTTITFEPNGSRPSAPIAPVAFTVPETTNANGALTLPIAVELDLTRMTQYGAPFGVTDLQQDGFAAGQLSAIAIEGNGIVMARYSNGQTRPAGQIELANFRNPQGLQPIGKNAWIHTFTSGEPIAGVAGNGNLGSLQAGTLEESNIDLTGELVNMIVSQRIYQANAQTIKTQDQVLQTLVNLR